MGAVADGAGAASVGALADARGVLACGAGAASMGVLACGIGAELTVFLTSSNSLITAAIVAINSIIFAVMTWRLAL